MGNSDVKLKHKVQLRKKVEEPDAIEEIQTEGPGVTPPEPQEPESPKSKNWLWWLLIALVIIGVIIWLFVKSDDKSESKTNSEPAAIEQTDSTTMDDAEGAESTDSVNAAVSQGETPAEEANTTEDVATGDPVATAPEAKPAQSTSTDMTSSVASSSVSDDVESEAMKVIRGDYGIGQERKNKLGSKYQPIQNRVNQLKREGLF